MLDAAISCSGRAARAVAACVLLTVPASGSWASEAPVTVEPSRLVLSGESGTVMDLLVEVTAVAKVEKVTFERGFLRRADDSTVWIAPEEVVFKPADLASLEAGSRHDVEISLSGAPEPGTYEGLVRLVFEPATLAAIEMPITVRASEPAIGLVAAPASRKLALGGLIGSNALRGSFTLKATRDVSGLAITAGSLKERERNSWIAAQSVAVTPSVTSLRRGEERIFEVAVASVAAPGLYEGTIEVGRTGSVETLRLDVSVDAVKLEAIPPTLVLPITNRLTSAGRARSTPVRATLQLTQEVPRPDSEVLRGLRPEFHLDPLLHATKKSEVLNLEPVSVDPATPSRGVDPKASSGTSMQTKLPLVFSSPSRRVAPGSYAGKLRVLSPSQGSVLTIPVEVKVRDPQWLAWILMVAGIVISWVISFWNTKGKKRNALRGELGRLQHDLANAATTARGRAEIEGLIATGHRLLTLGDLTKAQTHVGGIRARLTTAIATKQGLAVKLAEVEGLSPLFAELRAGVSGVLGKSQGRVFGYLDDLEATLASLGAKIRREDFASAADPALTQTETGLLTARTSLDSVVGALARAKRRILRIAARFHQDFRGKPEIGDELIEHHLEVLHERLERVERSEDVASLVTDLTGLGARLKTLDDVVRKLGVYHGVIEKEQSAQHPMAASSALVANFVRDLRVGQVPAETAVDAVWTTIKGEKPIAEAAPEVEESPAAGLFEVVGEAVHDGLVYETAQEPAAGGAGRGLRNLLSPEAIDRVVTVLLYLLALIILVPIGMDKTYLNNDTFGGLMSYLAVFLWGFGIQAGTATAAGVLTKLKV